MCGRNAASFSLIRLDMRWFYSLEPLFDILEEVTLMGWGQLLDAIFDNHVDVFAVSVDGANQETNDAIRRGSDLREINRNLRKIVSRKHNLNLKYPYINYVFCAMHRSLHELPELIDLAADIGLEEVKVVFRS